MCGRSMSNWFSSYASTPVGIALADAIDIPGRLFEFRALSEINRPAVQAVAADVTPIISALESKRDRDAASQFVGWYIGQIMRDAGYEVVQDRGRVSNAPYKTGAVWRQTNRSIQLVTEPPPVAGPGRLELRVTKDAGENIVASWTVTTSAMSRHGQPRRVHTIMSSPRPVEEALQEALSYAQRTGFPCIWINDPDHLFPKTDWPT
jgi:hypothetical protein